MFIREYIGRFPKTVIVALKYFHPLAFGLRPCDLVLGVLLSTLHQYEGRWGKLSRPYTEMNCSAVCTNDTGVN